MDFRAVLYNALKNKETQEEPIKYYSTKFAPPEKMQRNKVGLSVNVQKFLQKKEQEEKQKKEEAQKKKEALLALRSKDKKAVKRVNVMLKLTKSANQSVFRDAVHDNNTAVTLAGPSQPDEDDYGYVSYEADAFYRNMMEKYNKIPEETTKLLLDKQKVNTNLNSIKDRVRAALETEKQKAMMPHTRKRKHTGQQESSPDDENIKTKLVPKDEKQPGPKKFKVDKPRPKMPAPMNFNDLLKLAEKKQFEPIVIEKKSKEEESPLTQKQKREMQMLRDWEERKKEMEKSKSFNELLKSSEKKRLEHIVNEKKSKGEESPLTLKQKGEMQMLKDWQERNIEIKQSKSGRKTVETKEKVNKKSSNKGTTANASKFAAALMKGPSKKEVIAEPAKETAVRTKIDWGPKHPAAGRLNNVSSSSTANPQISTFSSSTFKSDAKDSTKPTISNNLTNKSIPKGNNSNNSKINKENSYDNKQMDRVKEKEMLRREIVSKPKQFPPNDMIRKPSPPSDVRRRTKIDWGPKHPAAGRSNNVSSSSTANPQISTLSSSTFKSDANDSTKPTISNNLTKNSIPKGNISNNSKINKENSYDNKKMDRVKEKGMLRKEIMSKPQQFLPNDMIRKPFPPSDVRRRPPPGKLQMKKRRIMDDDDDDYDSEMDDFIVDEPEEYQDYSKCIQEIFGYNKSKYAYADEEDDDIMESSFAQQMREEQISTRMGIMEDLEDIKMEEEHKRRKALMKKRKGK